MVLQKYEQFKRLNMRLNKFINSKKKIKPNSLDALIPVINKIQYIADNTKYVFGKYYEINFTFDLLNGVALKIDDKRIFLQTAFGENQIVDAVYNGGCMKCRRIEATVLSIYEKLNRK